MMKCFHKLQFSASDWLWFFFAGGIGCILRLRNLGMQLIMGDEIHALGGALLHTPLHNLTHFAKADNCIPLTVLYGGIAESVGMSEMLMRLPMLVAGIASLFIMPIFLRKALGRQATLLFTFLLSISLLHIYYSRFARPYVIVILLEFIAIASYYVWLRKGSLYWASIYTASIVLAVYFHMLAALFLVATKIFGLIWIFRTQRKQVSNNRSHIRWQMYLGICIAVIAGLLILLGPPFYFSKEALVSKLEQGNIHWRTLSGYGAILAGTWNPILTGSFFVLTVSGLYKLLKKERDLGLYALMLVIIPLSITVLMRPYKIDMPIVLVRYTIGVFPVLLALTALGIREIASWLGLCFRQSIGLKKAIFPFMGSCYVLALFLSGPLVPMIARPTGFELSPYTLIHTEKHTDKIPPSPFYEQLAQQPEKGTVVEYTWNQMRWGRAGLVLSPYQRFHGWQVIGAFSNPLLDDPRMHWRNSVYILNGKDMLKTEAKYVIVHRNIKEEVRFFSATDDTHSWKEPSAKKINEVLDYCTSWFGKPVFKDRWITVFDLQAKTK